MTWFYIQSEPNVYTVGHVDAGAGDFRSDSDWATRNEAAARVHYLNGSSEPSTRAARVGERIAQALEDIAEHLSGLK